MEFLLAKDTVIINLFKQLPVKIQVISEATTQCLMTLLTYTHNHKLLPRLVEGCKSKQNVVRYVASARF